MRRNAESSEPGWLGVVFGSGFARRITIAIAISLALHEILAALLPGAPQQEHVQEYVANVEVLHVVKATPTPVPRPTPAPVPVRNHAIVLAVPQKKTVIKAPSGASAHKEVIHHAGAARPKPQKISHAKPIWDIPVGAQGAGAGKGTGAGSLANGTNGTGTGSNGNGSGSQAAACGEVDFSVTGIPRYDRASGFYVYDRVKLIVHMSDGTQQELPLDYPWRYKSEAGDPFLHSNVPTFFEFPPENMRANEPPIVQYVMKHTNSYGGTTLNNCPGPVPTP